MLQDLYKLSGSWREALAPECSGSKRFYTSVPYIPFKEVCWKLLKSFLYHAPLDDVYTFQCEVVNDTGRCRRQSIARMLKTLKDNIDHRLKWGRRNDIGGFLAFAETHLIKYIKSVKKQRGGM